MPTQVQLRRGNTSDTLIFTGAAGEVTVDTDKKTIVVHDGTTSGGHNLSTEANTGAGNITVTNAYQANVGVAIASGQANTGAGLITVTNAYQANTGAVQIAKLDKAGGTITGNLTVSGITTLGNGAIFGTPASGTATNLTGLPLTSGVTGTLPVANGGTGLASGTSGGVLAYTAAGTLASSTALAASALVIGGGAGAAPSTTTTGTGVVTALGVNTGTAGAFVVNGGALGSPSTAGTMPAFTLGGTVSGGGNNINNVVIGASNPLAGAFTTLSASGQGAINSAIATNSTFQVAGTYAGTGGLFDGGLYVNVDGGTIGVNRTISQSYFGYGPDNAASTITTAASGTNDISTITIFPYVITSGGATLTNSTTLAINDAPNLGTNKRALWVKAGMSQLDGGLAVTGTLSSTLGATIQGLTVGLGAGAVATNTAVGVSALAANTSGAYNIALGNLALNANQSSSGNVAIGFKAGTATLNNFNIAIGSGFTGFTKAALEDNNSGAYNIGIGSGALGSNTTASNNTAVGYQAGYSNTTGVGITAYGYKALYANTTSSYSTAFGFNAGASNTGNGTLTAFGTNALTANTSGNSNVAFGGYDGISAVAGALQANTTGSNNTAVGTGSLAANTTASNNTAVGYQAGYTNTTGVQSNYVGRQAGYTSNANYCTMMGDQAGYASTGTKNTFYGYYAGGLMTTGASNTIIGGYPGNQGGLDIRTASNYIVLSDGDGNPRVSIPSTGAFQYSSTDGRAMFSWANVSSASQDLDVLFPNVGTTNGTFGLSVQIQVITGSSSANTSSQIIHGVRTIAGTWTFSSVSAIGSITTTASGSTNTLTLTFSAGSQFGRCVVNLISQN